MIAVAVLVCGFAIGMAGLLNYFKYRATANQVVVDRMIVTAKAVEGSIQAAMALGMQFSEIGTMPGTLSRESNADVLIVGIDIFDTKGRPLYSSDSLRGRQSAPDSWTSAVKEAGRGKWAVNDGKESAAGIVLRNNFDQPMGFMAVRFSSELVNEAARAVGRELAVVSLITFLVAALVSSGAVARVTRQLAREMHAVESALQGSANASAAALGADGKPAGEGSAALAQQLVAHKASVNEANAVPGDLGKALRRFLRTTQAAERRIAAVRTVIHPGTRR